MTVIRRLDSTTSQFDTELRTLLAYEEAQDASIEAICRDIIDDIRHEGDTALLRYTQRFDALEAADVAALEISSETLQEALKNLPNAQRTALETAAARIRAYHEHQLQEDWSYTEANGTRLGQRITPLDRVGLYVPGGKAAYPSSVLMNALPAKVAGVQDLIMVTPTPGGERNDLVLAAAALGGVDRVFAIGGAQAVAALAYGTETIPAVDKIVGPGNAYVAEAKRRVFGTVGIDMIAGPSETLIISDGSVSAHWIAMDLFSQAEHDELAQAILISPNADFLDAVEAEINRLLPTMPREEIIRTSLGDRGALIHVPDLDTACDIANIIAAEHLEIATTEPDYCLERIRHAGAIFLGPYSSESLGDYCAGPNHVLPTAQTARFSSPLGVYDFQKRSSIIHVSYTGAQTLGPIAATLAEGEGLHAHAQSAKLRLSITE